MLKRNVLFYTALLTATMAMAQNKVNITATDGTVASFNTADVKSITIKDNNVTVNPQNKTYKAAQIGFIKVGVGDVQITDAKGWLESAYVEWAPFQGAESYHVYIKGENISEYKKLDQQLVRNYGTYGRADAVGLKAGTYAMKVVPVINKVEDSSKASEALSLTVKNFDRSGYAHFNHKSGIGAYNNDGTLKENAIVLYITNKNLSTISCYIENGDKNKTPQVGLGKILQAYEKGKETRPLDIRFVGEIRVADQDASIQLLGEANCLNLKGKVFGDEQNITFEGIGEDATLNGIGIRFNRAGSVEVRNIGIMNQADDCFELTQCKYMWIHNVDMYYGVPGSDKDQVKGDGSTDTKKGASMETFSYNHYWDCGKASLCGLSGESTDDYITYHHNWFDHSDSRHPRVRVKSVHVYNNYYDGNSKYGIGATLGSSVFVEANYFRNCKYPMLSSMQGNDVYSGTSKYDPENNGTFSKEAGGIIKSYNNKIVDTNNTTCYWPYGATTLLTKGKNVSASSLGIDTKVHFDAYEVADRKDTVPASVVAFSGGSSYNNFDTDAKKIYSYIPDSPDDVPSIVEGYYGAGRMNHGDITWNFSDADDTNYSVDAKMRAMLSNYKTTLVGIFGDENASSGEIGEKTDTTGTGEKTDTTHVDQPVETLIVSFTGKAPSNSIVTVSGNYSTTKGTATYNNVTYSTCVKMERSTSIVVNAAKSYKMTLVFGDTETASAKINGTKITGSGSTYTQMITGKTTITKDKSVNIYAIVLEPQE